MIGATIMQTQEIWIIFVQYVKKRPIKEPKINKKLPINLGQELKYHSVDKDSDEDIPIYSSRVTGIRKPNRN
jgi:hypothetical protein